MSFKQGRKDIAFVEPSRCLKTLCTQEEEKTKLLDKLGSGHYEERQRLYGDFNPTIRSCVQFCGNPQYIWSSPSKSQGIGGESCQSTPLPQELQLQYGPQLNPGNNNLHLYREYWRIKQDSLPITAKDILLRNGQLRSRSIFGSWIQNGPRNATLRTPQNWSPVISWCGNSL